jgi:hypothetical protein
MTKHSTTKAIQKQKFNIIRLILKCTIIVVIKTIKKNIYLFTSDAITFSLLFYYFVILRLFIEISSAIWIVKT